MLLIRMFVVEGAGAGTGAMPRYTVQMFDVWVERLEGGRTSVVAVPIHMQHTLELSVNGQRRRQLY